MSAMLGCSRKDDSSACRKEARQRMKSYPGTIDSYERYDVFCSALTTNAFPEVWHLTMIACRLWEAVGSI